ncbi:MAG: hypothetical protein GY696_21060 [Gammaproteobacteria bacterium]|nr:hypothetical protein [Gammaproteobacteria bacterium]
MVDAQGGKPRFLDVAGGVTKGIIELLYKTFYAFNIAYLPVLAHFYAFLDRLLEVQQVEKGKKKKSGSSHAAKIMYDILQD